MDFVLHAGSDVYPLPNGSLEQTHNPGEIMKIYITGVFVHDQQRAFEFYTEKLGFVVKHDIPVGEFRWLTLVAKDDPEGVELLLEPSVHRAVGPFREALKEDGIPSASFEVEDLDGETERLKALGVVFVQEPTVAGPVKVATLDDTCGNLIQLLQRLE